MLFRSPTGTPAAAAFAVPAGLLTVAGVLARLVRCEWRLLEEGRATLGIVTRHEKVWHKTQGLRVHYEYHLLSGALRRGHIDKEKKKDAPAIGSTLVIVYDRESPSRKRLYPFQLVRCG